MSQSIGAEKEKTKMENQVRNPCSEDWTMLSPAVRVAHPSKHLSGGENMTFPDNAATQEAGPSLAEMKMRWREAI